MGIRFTRDKDAGDSGKRQIVITASPAACSGLAIVTLLCFVWVFVFGLIVGRGYQPEEIVPELKQFMPVAKSPSAFSNQTEAATADAADKPPQDIIKAEELNFYDQLKKAPAPHVPSKPKPPAAAAKPAPAVSSPPAQAKNTVPATPETHADSQVFDYVYQVAASQDLKAAESLKARLEAKGFHLRIESAVSGSVTWHRVMVLFRGTPENTRQLKDSLQEQGFAKPILKGKTTLQ